MIETGILRIKKQDSNGIDVFTKLKDPISMQWDLTDVDSDDGNGKNQAGKYFRDRITQKRQLSCTWGAMNSDQMKNLLSGLNDTFFTLEYPDALAGSRQTSEFYVSSRSTPMYSYDDESGIWLWNGMSAVLVER